MITISRPSPPQDLAAALPWMRNNSWLQTVRSSMSNVKKVTTETFRSDVIESDKPVVVDFWAEWCGPCKKLSPILEEVADELDGEVTIAQVNVDEERNLGAMFQIMSIPNVLIFNNGEKVDEFVGLRSKDDIVAQVKKQL